MTLQVVSANLKLCSSPDEGILLLTDLRTDIDGFITCIQGVIDAPRQNKGEFTYRPIRTEPESTARRVLYFY